MKIAIVQTDIIRNNPDANREHFEHLLKKVEHDTEWIIFPETFNTGFSIREENTETMDGKSIEWLKTVANSRHCLMEASLFIRENGKIFNRHLLVFPDGEIHYYDKKHRFSISKEVDVITPGNKRTIVSFNGWNIALFTCYDLRFPIWCRNRFEAGKYEYDIAVFVADWPEERIHAWRTLLPARAVENISYVIGVNRVSKPTDRVVYSGDSMGIRYDGVILTRSVRGEEGVLYMNINKSDLDNYRQQFPFAKDWDRFTILD